MSDLMREEFEAWVLGKWPKTRLKKISAESGAIYSVGNYVDPTVQLSWETWQASRECLVIELPKPRVARGYGEQVAEALGFNDGINYCEESIHAAGVKTK